MKKHIRRCYLILFTLLFSGCSLLPETKQYHVYSLPIATAAPKPNHISVSSLVLKIAIPYANQTLDSSRIAVMPERNQLTSYKGARWSDRLPILLRDHMIDTFRKDGRLQTVSTENSALNSDLLLTSEISAFQSEYRDGIPQVHIAIHAQLINANSRQIIASQYFEQLMRSNNGEISSVVDAFGVATTQLTNNILTWVINNQPIGGTRND